MDVCAVTLLIYTVMGKGKSQPSRFCNSLSLCTPVKIITECFLQRVPVMSALVDKEAFE